MSFLKAINKKETTTSAEADGKTEVEPVKPVEAKEVKPVKPAKARVKTVKPAEQPDREITISRGSDISRTFKILAADVLAAAMQDEPRLPIAGDKQARYWFLRENEPGKTARTSAMDYVIRVMRKLWEAGYR